MITIVIIVRCNASTGALGEYVHIARSLSSIHQLCADNDTDADNRNMFLYKGANLILEVGSKQDSLVKKIFEKECPSWRFLRTAVDYRQIKRCLLFEYLGY